MLRTLYYFHDPMCSWCWAFRPVWQEIVAGLPSGVRSQRVLGGLAPDTDQAMPSELQATIKSIWQQIQLTVPGTPFNFDFWDNCAPRRSTYAACRAVIAARWQNSEYEESMILAIQQAYYLQARNPSDSKTLTALASEIGLDSDRFTADMDCAFVHKVLAKEIEVTRRLGVKGFPTLLFEKEGVYTTIQHNYIDAESVLRQVERLLIGSP